MQTLPTAEGSLITGGVQMPLLTEDQLEPGVFITGNRFQSIWKVSGIDARAGIVSLWKQPEIPRAPGHVHSMTPIGTTASRVCTCGYREQMLRGDLGLIPLRSDTPRVYIIRPREAPLLTPDMFTVYLTEQGQVVTLTSAHMWSTLLPIIPALFPVWTLPEALRGRVSREPA